jgi:hypothetical protein
MRYLLWCIAVLLIMVAVPARAQDPVQEPIKRFMNAEGTALFDLWFFTNRIQYRFRGESDLTKRLDENQEEETVLFYDEGGVRKRLKVGARIALENGPPVSPASTKEHEIRGVTVWLEFSENDEEVGSFKVRGEDFVVVKKSPVTSTLEPIVFRGVTMTPSVLYHPLQDLAGPAYIVKMEGLRFVLKYAE